MIKKDPGMGSFFVVTDYLLLMFAVIVLAIPYNNVKESILTAYPVR